MQAIFNKELSSQLQGLDLKLAYAPHLKPEVTPRLVRFARLLQNIDDSSEIARLLAREISGEPSWMHCSVCAQQGETGNYISAKRHPKKWGDVRLSNVQEFVQEISHRALMQVSPFQDAPDIVVFGPSRLFSLGLSSEIPEGLSFVGVRIPRADGSPQGIASLLFEPELSPTEEECHIISGICVLAGARLEQLYRREKHHEENISDSPLELREDGSHFFNRMKRFNNPFAP